jgi:tRNA/tmRNA/rRNA uracil-C5-methylase (TrmA/RlmC/RlmD family)
MNAVLKHKMIAVCNQKIEAKGFNMGLSFYAFFQNKNTQPELLMEAAEWWIQTHQLDHFEKATKIKAMVESIKN